MAAVKFVSCRCVQPLRIFIANTAGLVQDDAGLAHQTLQLAGRTRDLPTGWTDLSNR